MRKGKKRTVFPVAYFSCFEYAWVIFYDRFKEKRSYLEFALH